jgi:hypothetical protein
MITYFLHESFLILFYKIRVTYESESMSLSTVTIVVLAPVINLCAFIYLQTEKYSGCVNNPVGLPHTISQLRVRRLNNRVAEAFLHSVCKTRIRICIAVKVTFFIIANLFLNKKYTPSNMLLAGCLNTSQLFPLGLQFYSLWWNYLLNKTAN